MKFAFAIALLIPAYVYFGLIGYVLALLVVAAVLGWIQTKEDLQE